MILLVLLLNCLQIDKTSYGFGWPGSILVKENFLYLANGTVLSIYDISRPETPKLVKNLSIPGYVTAMSEGGGYLYMGFYNEGLGIYDISSPLYPDLICICPELKFIRDIKYKSGIIYSTDYEGYFSIYAFLDICTPVLLSKKYLQWVKKILIYENYAYITYGGGVAVFDISNPSNPIFLTNPCPVSLNDISIDNGIFYGIEDSCIYMVDLSDPANPIDQGFVCSRDFFGYKILLKYPYAIILGTRNLIFLDITEPFYPKIIGYSAPITQNYNITINDDFIFLSGSSGIEILPFGDPHSPVPISNLPELNIQSPVKTFVEEDLLYRLDSAKFEVWDIKDPYNPFLLFRSTAFKFVDFVVRSKILFFLNEQSLEIWDFSNPSNPQFLNKISYDLRPLIRIFLHENYLICASPYEFLILDITEPANPIELNRVMDYESGQEIVFLWPYLAKASHKLKIWDLSDWENPKIKFEKTFNDQICCIEFFDLENVIISFYNRDFALLNIENENIISKKLLYYPRFLKVYSNYIFASSSLETYIIKVENESLKTVGYYPDEGPIAGKLPYIVFNKTIGDFSKIEGIYPCWNWKIENLLDAINDGDNFYFLTKNSIIFWNPNFQKTHTIYTFSKNQAENVIRFLYAGEGMVYIAGYYFLYILDCRNPENYVLYSIPHFFPTALVQRESQVFFIDIHFSDFYQYYYELHTFSLTSLPEPDIKFLGYFGPKIAMGEKYLATSSGCGIAFWNIENLENPYLDFKYNFNKKCPRDFGFIENNIAISVSNNLYIYEISPAKDLILLSTIEEAKDINSIFLLPYIVGLQKDNCIGFWSILDLKNPVFLDEFCYSKYEFIIRKVLPFGYRFGLFIISNQISIWNVCNCLPESLNIKCPDYGSFLKLK